MEDIARAVSEERGGEIALTHDVSGTAFLTEPGPFTELLSAAIMRITGEAPGYSTGGGTSDARFIKDYCPVAELGLSGRTMHKNNECVALTDIETLTRIYQSVLALYFADPPQ